ncbi:hypothetical protein [Rodentibacter pneumotropicus]|uniref:hypothetical protein n=1 Tax=Rodentibacter pneumotropicus TaxID=758 RepID=UPI00109D132A|nr:hypothetical protein [Rodentibacter pneumotropicus]THA14561.1 hypothetical protein D3M82_07510 [Rodentibacter pneumotropicus]
MTKSSQYLFFAQEYCEKHNLTHEEIHRISILQSTQSKQPNNGETVSQRTEQAHQAIRAIFSQLRQSARETHSPHHQSHQGDAQVHAKDNQARVLEFPVVSEVDKAVFEFLQVYLDSDRSPYELLKLSNCLFNLGQAYIKNGK